MITVDAAKGGEASNSYATTAEADAVIEVLYGPGPDEWATLDADTKARLLITATRVIEKMPVKYDKADASQKLKFPVFNSDDESEDGFDKAKEACIQQALYLLEVSDLIRDSHKAKISGRLDESIGPMSRSIAGYNPMAKYAPLALNELSAFVDFGQVIRRG